MRLILSLVLLVFTLTGFGQDLIVKKDGIKIYCEIKKVDSLSIYYIKAGLKQGYQISRAEVQSYFIYGSRNLDTQQEPEPGIKPEDEKLIVSAFYGIANPVGEFGSKDLEKTTSGLALKGNLYSVNAVLKFSKHLGVKLIYHNQSNGFDLDLLRTAYENKYRGVTFEVRADKWKVSGFFGGLHISVPFKTNKNLFLDLDLIGGLPKCHLPEIVIKGTYNGVSITDTYQSSKINAVTMMPALGLRYYVFEKLALNFNLNYLLTKVTFGDVGISSTNGYRGLTKVTQQISSLNALFGLSFMVD